MVDQSERTIAQRYAQALLHVYGDQITADDIEHIDAAATFLAGNNRALFFLRLIGIEQSIKERCLQLICERFHLGVYCHAIMKLLLADKRTFLVFPVFQAIVSLYRQRQGILAFTMMSSHQLTSSEEHALHAFLARSTGKKIIYTRVINAQLIAGVRLQSDTWLWQYSIRNRLAQVKESLKAVGLISWK
jgi:F-type H+-transporting ATPase subunit delta